MQTSFASSWVRLPMLVASITGCSSSSSTSPDAASLRPGVVDSSLAYQGTPNADESAFWTAVRGADDAGRVAAVSQLKADVANDPRNGYSEFLIGASYFMSPNTVLSALANGTPPPQGGPPDPAAIPFLKQGLANLTDPFYLGFDGGLLGFSEITGGDPAEGGPTFATAVMNNHAATALMTVIGDLQKHDSATALHDMYGLVEFCNGGAVDHGGADVGAYVAKLNAGAADHRECYSGYFAPHGSSGELLILGDLQALAGNAEAATAYYTAVQNTTDYTTWPLRPLVQRRLAGTQPADIATTTVITTSCATCHTSSL